MALADYTLTLNNGSTTLTLSSYVASLTPGYQRRNVKSFVTVDGKEYAGSAKRKHVLKVAFKPMTGAQLKSVYDWIDALSDVVWYTVTYRDPTNGGDTITKTMRIANEWETKFLLKSVDGNRYYAGFTMELREQ